MWTPTGGRTIGLSFNRVAPLALLLLAACGEDPSRSPDRPNAHWVSEPAFRIGDALAGDALFGFIPSLRVSPDGRRVYVLEPYEAKVSVWTPDGRPLFEVGGTGKGPGDFMLPYRVHLGDSWFYVRDQSRFTYFSNDRKILRTVPNPPTLLNYRGFPIRVNTHLSDGSFLGFPTRKPPTGLELGCRDDAEEKPVLRVRETATGWVHELVFRRKYGNGTLAVPTGIGCYYGPHPYSDADLYRADPDAGSVVVVRMSLDDLDPGRSELFEVSAAGDTLWKRGLVFQPIRLTRDMLEAALNDVESVLDDRFRRDAVERALNAPEYLPAVSDFALASNGRIWLRSPEVRDTLSVWYSLERGDTESPPQRVLLPEGFKLMDATDTHVWGVWKDELDISYVVGRRLVPGS